MRLHLILALAIGALASPAPHNDDVHQLAKRDRWPDEVGVQLYTGSGSSSCLTTGFVAESTPVYVEDCTGSAFPGWILPSPGDSGAIRLANTRFCLDAGPNSDVSAGKHLSLRPCSTTGPCNPTIGNAQIWWGLQGSAATDYWIELAGTYRVPPKHTGLCVRADMEQGRAVLACCFPSHDNVTAVDQLWSTQQHG